MEKYKVYLDNCCYNRPYDDQSQVKVSLEAQAKLHVQHLIIDKKLTLVYSFVSRFENSQNPFEIRRNAISGFFSNAEIYVDESHLDEIRGKVDEIMATGIKTKDAYHIACAIYGKADYFLSTDIRLLKYQTNEIRLINPVNFVTELEG